MTFFCFIQKGIQVTSLIESMLFERPVGVQWATSRRPVDVHWAYSEPTTDKVSKWLLFIASKNYFKEGIFVKKSF